MGSAIEILVLQVLAYQMQEDIPAALTSLEHALRLAEPEGYLRMFVDEGEPMRLLIEDFRSKIENPSRHPDEHLVFYVLKLLDAFRSFTGAARAPNRKSQSKIQNLIEPLSRA